MMNDNPYNSPATQEEAPGNASDPPVKKRSLLLRLFRTFLFGSILAVLNLFGGMILAIACTISIGYIPEFFPFSLTFFVLALFFLNFFITPAFALTICWGALSQEKPVWWCKRNWRLFLIAFAFPFALTCYLNLAGALQA